MKRWVSNLPIPPVQKWQSRAEILREHNEQLERSQLLRFKSSLERIRREIFARKYDPNQPRVPAGNPDGGQWTSGTGGEGTTNDPMESYAAARRRGRSLAYCLRQYAIDGLHCNSLEPSQKRPCWAQASERLGNCIAGRPIPPLNY
jgi:hypothetical protein